SPWRRGAATGPSSGSPRRPRPARCSTSTPSRRTCPRRGHSPATESRPGGSTVTRPTRSTPPPAPTRGLRTGPRAPATPLATRRTRLRSRPGTGCSCPSPGGSWSASTTPASGPPTCPRRPRTATASRGWHRSATSSTNAARVPSTRTRCRPESGSPPEVIVRGAGSGGVPGDGVATEQRHERHRAHHRQRDARRVLTGADPHVPGDEQQQELGDHHEATPPAPATEQPEPGREQPATEDREPYRRAVPADGDGLLAVAPDRAHRQDHRDDDPDEALGRGDPARDPHRGRNSGPGIRGTGLVVRLAHVHLSSVGRGHRRRPSALADHTPFDSSALARVRF